MDNIVISKPKLNPLQQDSNLELSDKELELSSDDDELDSFSFFQCF